MAGDVAVRVIVTWCCNCIFHGEGDAAAAASEVIMVRKYCEAIYFSWLTHNLDSCPIQQRSYLFIETVMFLYVTP
jgi:hypothetical protein